MSVLSFSFDWDQAHYCPDFTTDMKYSHKIVWKFSIAYLIV